MTKSFITGIVGSRSRFLDCLKTLLPGLVVLALTAGCQTQSPLPADVPQATNATKVIILRGGDVVKISFPEANANLNTTQPIRRDGMIYMPLIGEVKAAGKTPKELEQALLDLYSTRLPLKEVTVEVQSSSLSLLVSSLAAGQTQTPLPLAAPQSNNTTEIITLRESDVVKISFPANANLNTTQPIRRDGMISMPLIGEVKAAGKTPKELEKALVDLYSTQLLSKEVTVEVQSSTFPIYVTGSVLHPGRIMSDHPITALEAVMEAGGFDYVKANLKKVQVTRREAGGTRLYILNLKEVMEGKEGEPFYLKPADIVYVPEKFTWF